jgi:hypothetical protein
MANIGFREDCKLSFKSLKILTFPSLYIYKCLEYIIKNINVYNPLNFHHNYETRGNDICVNLLKLIKSRHGSNYYCIKLFNTLPPFLKKEPFLQLLGKIKKYLIFKSFYSIGEFLNNNFNDFETVCIEN